MHDTGFAHPLIRSIIDVRHTDQKEVPVVILRNVGTHHVLCRSPHIGEYIVHRGWFSVYRTIKKRYGLTEQEVRSLVPYSGKRGKQ